MTVSLRGMRKTEPIMFFALSKKTLPYACGCSFDCTIRGSVENLRRVSSGMALRHTLQPWQRCS